MWEKYSYEERDGSFVLGQVMYLDEFREALSDYSPWISDREPTVEDGGMDGMVLVQVPYYTREG